MLVKLRFSSNQNPYIVFKIFDYLINNRPATGTNIATLLTAAGATTLASYVDTTNSSIWNNGTGITALTSNTVSKFGKQSANAYTFEWVVEQTAYDSSNIKHLTRVYDGLSTAATGVTAYCFNYSSASGSMLGTYAGESITALNWGTATIGTSGALATTNGYPAATNNALYTATFMSNQTTGGWLYVTDNCILFALTGGALSLPNGFPAGSNLTTGNFRGWVGNMQYTRTDPWNTAANGIPPWVSTLQPTGGGLLGDITHTTLNWNVGSTTSPHIFPIGADKIVDCRQSTTNTTGPIITGALANLGVGNRFNHLYGLSTGLNTAQTAVGTTYATAQVGSGLVSTAGYRYVNSDLKSQTFAMLPITWAIPFYNVAGGNITDKTGIYWFNGDYFPGDILTYNGETYVLCPGAFDNSNRIALAIPRE